MTDRTDTVTLPPCPPWCTWPAGHETTSQDIASGHLVRGHVARDFGPLPGGHTVEVEADELTTEDGELVRVEDLHVGLDFTSPLTASDARRVALALALAADLLDEITSNGG